MRKRMMNKNDYHQWMLYIERSLYNDLKHICLDEGQSINEFCKPAIDVFKNELIKIRDSSLTTRKKQFEDARITAEHPLPVTGVPVEPITEIIDPQTC